MKTVLSFVWWKVYTHITDTMEVKCASCDARCSYISSAQIISRMYANHILLLLQ